MRRSRANPFKSTQLRQWGFICYLGGHIVSRRERTDRLRRASDGAAPREPAPTDDAAPRERLYPLPLHSLDSFSFELAPFLSPFLPPSLPPSRPPALYFTAAILLLLLLLLLLFLLVVVVVNVAAIRQKSGFAVTRPRRNFPRIAHTPLPSALRRTGLSHLRLFLEIFDGKIWPFVCAFVPLASEAERAGLRTGDLIFIFNAPNVR